MSLAFSNTTTKHGIMQRLERELGFNYGDITGDPTIFSGFTSDVNTSLDKVFAIIFEVGGTWQFDDNNHTDFPIMSTQLNAGQRDYSFAGDEHNYLVLDLYKVMVSDENGNYREVVPVDAARRGNAPSGYDDGLNTRGQPNTYDVVGQSILLDPIPSYTKALGLKVYISREGSYFTSGDTTKKPGFAGLFHEYLVLDPAYNYAARKGLESADDLKVRRDAMEEAIKNHYKAREKDVVKRVVPRTNNAH